MTDFSDTVRTFCSRVWAQRTKILALLLAASMLTPQPVEAQFFPIDMAAIVSAIGAINTAITNVICTSLTEPRIDWLRS